MEKRCGEGKGKEGTVVIRLIKLFVLDGVTLCWMLLHCQTETLNLVTQRRGDFIVGIKGHQKQRYKFVKSRFTSHYDSDELIEFTEKNKGLGRTEQRTVMQISADLPEVFQRCWLFKHSLIEVTCEREREKLIVIHVGM